jgi:hypothetical protein
MPYGKPLHKPDGSWDVSPAREAMLDRTHDLLPPEIQSDLRNWWLKNPGGSTPCWDLAVTWTVKEEKWLLLVEAKAHANELDWQPKPRPEGNEKKPWENHRHIGRQVSDAAAELQRLTGNSWGLSRDRRYQLSNRFAWAWKIALMGHNVVLIYLGFLNARDMERDGPLFQCSTAWESAMIDYCAGVVDCSCWGRVIKIGKGQLLPLLRTYDQPFNSHSGKDNTPAIA